MLNILNRYWAFLVLVQMRDIYINVPDYNNREGITSKADSTFNLHIRMGDRIYNCYNTLLENIEMENSEPTYIRSCGYLDGGFAMRGMPRDTTQRISFRCDYMSMDYGQKELDNFDIACNKQPQVIEKIVEKEKIIYKEKRIPTHREILHSNYSYYIKMI